MITKLTKEQENRFKEWADKWIKHGLSTERADWPRFEKAAKECYRFAGLNDSIPIIHISSPIVGTFAAPIAALIISEIKQKNGSSTHSAVDSVVRSAVDSAVRSAVGSTVDSAVDSAVESAVYSVVGSAVHSAVESAVGSAVESAVGSAVRSAVDSAVGSAVGSMVRSEVESAVDSAVDSAVRSAVDSAVGSAVGSAVHSAVHSAVNSAVDSAIYSAVHLAVNSAVDSAIRSAVHSAVNSAVGLAVYSAVDSAVDSAIRSAIRSAVDSRSKNLFWHYWFGGSLWQAWNAYNSFFFEICGLKNASAEKKFKAYSETCLSAGYWWPNKDFIMVCDRPTKIDRNSQGKLHCENDMAIKWIDGWGLWMLNGVQVPEWLVKTHADALDPKKILEITNADQRAEGIRKLGIERLIKYGKVVDTYKNYNDNMFYNSKYELVDMAAIFKSHKNAYFLKMQNQSVPSVWHLEGVHPSCNTLDKALRWRFKIKEKTYKIMEIK